MGNEGAATPALLDEFHRLNPDLRVSVQALPWTAAHEKLLTAYAGDSLPDVSQVGFSWIAELTAIGAATPVPPGADDIVAGGFDSVMETNRIGGRLMGAPWYVDTRLVFHRTDLLARAGYDAVPQTWAEWKTCMHGVKRVMDVPANYADRYVTAMPIHEKLRAKDDTTIHNYLKANLCNVHEDFVRRVDVAAVRKDLIFQS